MIAINDFTYIMDERTTKNKLKSSSLEVEVIYEVFKDTSKYISPELITVCSKTALEIAYYILYKLKPNQTSIRLKPSSIVNSDKVNCKTSCGIRNAISELVKAKAIVKWRDIITEHSNISVDKFWYLLNPNKLKAIGCKTFKEQVNTTIRQLNNSSNYTINEYSAIVYNFNNFDL